MKENINKIIEESLYNSVKDRIINEQGNLATIARVLPAVLSQFNIKETNFDGDNATVHLNSIPNDVSIDNLIKDINKGIHNGLKNNGLEDNYDVDIAVDDENDELNIKIKITTNKELGSENIEDMENVQQINEKWAKDVKIEKTGEHADKTVGQLKKEINALKGKPGNKEKMGELLFALRAKQGWKKKVTEQEVEENIPVNPYFVTQEEEDCVECDKQMEEESGMDDPGKEYFDKIVNQYKSDTDESELAGTNDGIENTTSNFITYESDNTKKHKKIRLSESEFQDMLQRIVTEAIKTVGKEPKIDSKTKPYKDATTKETKQNQNDNIKPKNVPGLDAVKRAHDKTDKLEKEHMDEVSKKIEDYLDFDGNDKPEFPNQVGKGEKVKANRDGELGDESQEYVDNYRGMKPEDAAYDTEPTEEYKDRMKKSITGDKTMGNAAGEDTANAIKTDVGEKVFKNIEKKRKAMDEDPMYVKDEQPVEDEKKYRKTRHDPGFETVNEDVQDITEEEKEKIKAINEDLKKMKTLSSYDKKTQ